MDWHGFLKEVLSEHGGRVKRASGPVVAEMERWSLEPGSVLTMICEAQSHAFRADDGYTIQLDQDFALISRDRPVHEAMYFFYPHVAAIRLQKADMPSDNEWRKE